MRQAVIRAPRRVDLDEVPRPTPPGGGVLVAVKACGLCTWEQRVYRGARPQYPFAGGHEIAGVVVTADSAGPAPGTQVAVSRLPRCGHCAACRAGKDNLCAYTAGGSGDGPGGLSDYLVADARDVVPVDSVRSAAEAALVEPLACVLNSLHVAHVGPGTRLAVIGNGFMGALHARAAQAVGGDVTLYRTGPPPAGLEHAWAGPAHDIRAEADGSEFAIEGSDFDAVIVIRAVRQNLGAAAHLVRPGGLVSVFASQPPDELIMLPSRVIRRKEICVTAAASHRAVDFAEASRVVSNGVVRVDDLVHRAYSLDAIGEALDYASDYDTGRIVVDVNAG